MEITRAEMPEADVALPSGPGRGSAYSPSSRGSMRRSPSSARNRWPRHPRCWQRSRGLYLDGGWGVKPYVTYFPSAAKWPEVAPEWAMNKRDLVLQRLIDHGPVHRVEETDVYPGPIGVTR